MAALAVKRSLRAVILAAVGLSLMLTGCTVTGTGRPAAAPDLGRWQPPMIPTARLGDLLLTVGEINSIASTTGMAVRMPISEMSRSETLVSDVNCLDAYSPIQRAVYQGSNWLAVQGQLLEDAPSPANPINHALVQAVVGFRDADSAQQFFSQAKARWAGCANRPLTIQRPGRTPVTWDFGSVVATETTLSMEQSLGRSVCQRAMGLANNVIIDTLWCGLDTSNQGSQVVTKIADEISQA